MASSMQSSRGSNSKTVAVVMAGGHNSRMKSSIPKVLHTICGVPMILYTTHVLQRLHLPTFIWYRDERVRAACAHLRNVYFVKEDEPRGTGHALRTVHGELPRATQTLLTLHGDSSAFFRLETYQKLLQTHARARASLTLLTQKVPLISNTGRIVRDQNDDIIRNEELSDLQCDNCEINAGVFVFRKKWLDGVHADVGQDLHKLRAIVDYTEHAHNDGVVITHVDLTDGAEKMHVNTSHDLARVQSIAQKRIEQGLLITPQIQ